MNEQDELRGWFAGRVPADWFVSPPEITSDRDEILVVGELPDVELGADATPEGRTAARQGRIKQFREDTRGARIRIAQEAERRFDRKVSWGARCGDVRELFTTLSLPVMTRLRLEERAVLDALVEAGVTRSRSHALAWCVRLVGKHQGEWINELRAALAQVEHVRAQGPQV
jgi:hypothetical protein